MHKLYELKEKLINELEDYADNGKFSKDDVEAIKYTASAIDHICNIVCDEEEYSEAMNGGMMMDRSYEGGRSYRGGGSSYRRSGRRGANQYGSYGRNQYGSYAGGYSRANEDVANELREIAKDAPSDHVRQEIHSLVSRIENM